MNFQTDFENYINLQYLISESNKLLHEKFHEQWLKLYGSEWLDGQKSGEYFLCNKIGKKIFQSMNTYQKNLAKAGDSSKWDISFYYILFSNFTFEKKNFVLDQVEQIKMVRNEIAHMTSMNITKEQYESAWNRLTKSMLLLGYSENKLNKFKHELNKRNLENTEKSQEAEKLKKDADRFFGDKNFKKAIDCYTKCLNVRDLSDNERAVFYSNRSLAYLKLYQVQKEKNRDILFKALVDAEQANSFNPRWFKAYARLGQVYQELNELDRSIEYYEKALILHPGDEEIKNSLANVKRINFDQARLSQFHFDESSQPMTLEERCDLELNKLRERIGQPNLNFNVMEKIKKFANEKDLKDLWKGHEYRDGSKNCEQNYEKAALHFSKAAKNGNPEAMYQLALLTMKGQGVKLDYNAAINLLKQAANQPEKLTIGNHEVPNPGVAESEHALGLAYETGTYVNKSESLAAHWYQRAVDHEYGPSANNLGLLYIKGEGVSRDLDRAENLFLYAHKKDCEDAMLNLVDVYMQKMDPEKALLWHKRAMEKGSMTAISRNDSVLQAVEEIRTQVNKMKKELIDDGESIDDITNMELIDKYMIEKYSDFKDLRKLADSNNNTNPMSVQKETFDIKMLYNYAKRGSKTAEKMLKASFLFQQSLLKLDDVQTETEFEKLVFKLAKAFEICSLVCQVPIDLMDELMENLEKIMSRNQVNELDYSARVCYSHLISSDIQKTIKFTTESLKKYPNKYFLNNLRGHMYAFVNKFDKSLDDLNVVLRHEPKCYEILCSKASALRLLNRFRESIEVFKKYLEFAPADDRKVPESYYAIGICEISARAHVKDDKEEVQELVNKYLKLGLEAEKKQLPCFLPVSSNVKTALQSFAMALNFDAKPKNNKKQAPKKEIKEDVKLIKDEYRIQIVKQHRQAHNQFMTINEKHKDLYKTNITISVPKTQKMPHNLAGLKNITLKQIDFNKDHILKSYILNLKIIEIPIFLTGVHFVVEDENKNVERMSIYNLGDDYGKIAQDFKVGTEFSIVNPYVRKASDGKPVIRVDDPSSILFSGRCVNKMCRYCGAEDSKFNCAKCDGKVFYCSKECQVKDWTELDHKLICF